MRACVCIGGCVCACACMREREAGLGCADEDELDEHAARGGGRELEAARREQPEQQQLQRACERCAALGTAVRARKRRRIIA